MLCTTQRDGIQGCTLGPVQYFIPETLEDRTDGDLVCSESKHLVEQEHV